MTNIIGEELTTACPFCDGALAVSHDPPSVMHALPMCHEFQRNEPHVFLRKVREALERARSTGGR